MEYLFKKEDLQAVIDGSPESDYISIKLQFKFGSGVKEFTAEIIAEGYTKSTGAASATSAKGCPNPPGCN